MRRHLHLAAQFLAALTLAAPAFAQSADDFPNRPIRIIVTQAAGSGVDLQARAIAQKMGEVWGRPGVVENRAGANGMLGMEAVAKAAPDGYTLVYASASVLAMNQFIYKKLPYDALRDFTPVIQTVANPMGLVVNPSTGIKSVKDLVERAKTKPGEVNYGSFGIGNMTHLMGEMLSGAANIKMTHVPYRGQTPAITDVLSGQIPLAFTTLAGATELVKAGKLNLLATFGETRDDTFPEVPTMREMGYRDVIMVGWAGLLAPANVPPQILSRLHAGLAKAMVAEDVKEAMAKQGSKAASGSAEEFAKLIKSEASKFQAVIKAAGLEGSQ